AGSRARTSDANRRNTLQSMSPVARMIQSSSTETYFRIIGSPRYRTDSNRLPDSESLVLNGRRSSRSPRSSAREPATRTPATVAGSAGCIGFVMKSPGRRQSTDLANLYFGEHMFGRRYRPDAAYTRR